MNLFGASIGFAAPWLLVALAALPVLWLLLRAVPPAPVRRFFPGVILLLGLRDDDQITDRTPWWLLLLRMLAVAALIIGLAGPVLNPQDRSAGNAPLLVLLDGSWASARDWTAQEEMVKARLSEAARDGRYAAVIRLSDPQPLVFQPAETWETRLPGLAPRPWAARADDTTALIAELPDRIETLWLSDGLDRPGRADLADALVSRGTLRVATGGAQALALHPALFDEGAIALSVSRAAPGPARRVTVAAQGRDPNGLPAVLARLEIELAAGALRAEAQLSLPAELRARVTRFEIEGQRSAGAVTLTDDGLLRREVALIAGRDDREGLELLSPLHYLDRALRPTADILTGALTDVLPANPDVVVLADVATLTPAETDALTAWTEAGGMLLRFAGPRLAASDLSRESEDPLMPVRLRAGGRSVGGTMSWGEPKTLAPFSLDSPFFGLPVPGDVRVTAQVMAQPDPTLADRVIAQLTDGTPLVTRKAVGQGQVVLFHVTANAEWSSVPLSGLFVQMLERLAVSTATARPEPGDLTGTTWQPQIVLDAFGRVEEAGTLPGVAGDALIAAPLGPDLRPGVYASDNRRIARNVIATGQELTPATWPDAVIREGLSGAVERPLGGLLLALALILLAADVLATLALSGRLRSAAARSATAAALAFFACLMISDPAAAQSGSGAADTDAAIEATAELHLAHVLTGNRDIDLMAEAGLRGLSDTLFFRTSVEPGAPRGVDLERDDLSFFPLLYWPITPDQPRPSSDAYARLNQYLRSGGMILFDTRDANVAGFGTASANGRKLQQLAAPLDIPALEPVPEDHVLTRAFYLLQDFPGRHTGREVWVEAAPPDAERAEGMPFRNLNDGVTPVVIGGNDWAAAWATDTGGQWMYPVGRGFAGERQRELAYRFGVNLVMHVLTGNYKSDQVHVPALLDRLGQ